MNPRSDEDLYAQVIDIAQEQAKSTAAMAELHRQNVSKMDTMAALLSAQTTSLVGVSTALQHMNEARSRFEAGALVGREDDVAELKGYITQEFKQREVKFWLALSVIALSGSSDAIIRLVGLFK